MDISDELYDKFTQELDRSLYLSSEYGDVIDRFNKLFDKYADKEGSQKLDELIGEFGTVVAKNIGISAMKLGAKLIASLLK